jgi:hypothetical protein
MAHTDQEPSPTFFDDPIRELKRDIAEKSADLEIKNKRLAWYEDGRQLFGASGAAADAADDVAIDGEDTAFRANQIAVDPQSKIEEILPPREVMGEPDGARPSLRQAILYVLTDLEPQNGVEVIWAAKDIITALEARGWAPRGVNADHQTRGMLRSMAERGQLERPGRGQYRLAQGLRESRLMG